MFGLGMFGVILQNYMKLLHIDVTIHSIVPRGICIKTGPQNLENCKWPQKHSETATLKANQKVMHVNSQLESNVSNHLDTYSNFRLLGGCKPILSFQ
jgi:hypothetical protein